MISSFRVEGFKSLVMERPVDLGLFNVFIGANGSGKSNLLEAFGVMGAAAFGSVEVETLRYRGVRLGLPKLYKTSFKGRRIRRVITMEAVGSEATYRVTLDNPIDNPEKRWRICNELLSDSDVELLTRSPRSCLLHRADGSREKFPVRPDESAVKPALFGREDAPRARALVDALTGYAIFSPTTPVLRGIATEGDVSRDPLGLSGGGLPEAVRTLYDARRRRFGAFDLDDVWELIEWADAMAAVPSSQELMSPALSTAPVVLRFHDRHMRTERSDLSAYDASEGALYVLFLLALASHEKSPAVFSIDNFDHALHPRLARALTRLVSGQVVADGRRQMLLTTHNPLVLDGLDLMDDRVRLFAVERDGEGHTGVRRVQVTPELWNEAERGIGLSRLWVMGRLGGVPRAL